MSKEYIGGKAYEWLSQEVYDVWRKFGLDAKVMRQLFPARYRKTPVTCPITGQETHLIPGISHRAWELVRKGLEAEAAQEAADADRKWYALEYGQYPRWENLAGSGSDNFRDEIDSICQLSGLKYTRTTTLSPRKDWDGESWLVEKPDKERINWDLVYYYLLSPAECERLRKLIRNMQSSLDRCASYNSHSGQAFMVAMAKGEQSIDDYNKLVTKSG